MKQILGRNGAAGGFLLFEILRRTRGTFVVVPANEPVREMR
jgi:hypothetical protein